MLDQRSGTAQLFLSLRADIDRMLARLGLTSTVPSTERSVMNDAAKRALDALLAIVEDTDEDSDVRIRAAGTILAGAVNYEEKVGATA